MIKLMAIKRGKHALNCVRTQNGDVQLC